MCVCVYTHTHLQYMRIICTSIAIIKKKNFISSTKKEWKWNKDFGTIIKLNKSFWPTNRINVSFDFVIKRNRQVLGESDSPVNLTNFWIICISSKTIKKKIYKLFGEPSPIQLSANKYIVQFVLTGVCSTIK